MRSTSVSGLGLAFLAAVALAACGSDNTGPGSTACSVTISGATAPYTSVNGTFDCVVVAVFATAANQSGVTVSMTTPALNATACFTGEVTQTTHVSTEVGAACGTSLTSGSAVWAVIAGPGGSGSYTMALTSVSTLVTNPGVGKSYSVDGTLDATLLPTAGTPATGNITVHAVF